MRFYELMSFRHVVGFIFPTITFILVFAVGLAFMHLDRGDTAKRQSEILYRFPGGIEDRNQPFPLVMLLIIAGTVLWVFFYILGTGVMGVKI